MNTHLQWDDCCQGSRFLMQRLCGAQERDLSTHPQHGGVQQHLGSGGSVVDLVPDLLIRSPPLLVLQETCQNKDGLDRL